MTLLVILIISAATSLVFGYWQLAIGIAILIVVFASIIWMTEGFQKCPKCGSRLTVQISEHSADVSHGPSKMHEYIRQECWNPRCGKTKVPRDIEAKLLDKEITGDTPLSDLDIPEDVIHCMIFTCLYRTEDDQYSSLSEELCEGVPMELDRYNEVAKEITVQGFLDAVECIPDHEWDEWITEYIADWIKEYNS